MAEVRVHGKLYKVTKVMNNKLVNGEKYMLLHLRNESSYFFKKGSNRNFDTRSKAVIPNNFFSDSFYRPNSDNKKNWRFFRVPEELWDLKPPYVDEIINGI